MEFSTISVGTATILYGIYTIVIRKISPHKFGKLEAMKEKLGDAAGNRAHIFFYSAMPILFGSLIVYAGIKGVSLAQFFLN